MLNHLPILQVILPLLAAPACLILDRPRLAWLFASAVCLLSLAISIVLVQQVNAEGAISYMLGGWDAPWGIEYRIDKLSAYVLLVVSGIAALTVLAAHTSIVRELDTAQQPAFYVLFLLCLAGLLGIVATGDVFNIFVFLEISSLATYALIALGKDRRSLWAAYQYLIVGTIGATFFLIGIGLLYSITGTLNIADLNQRLGDPQYAGVATAAFAFIVVGIFLKLALFPLHGWLPNAYAYAPSIVTAFLAATATKVALYLLMRMHFSVFGAVVTVASVPLNTILLALGLASVIAASLVAIQQTHVKRLFAFSSVAQIGYMVIGMGLGTTAGLQAALLHLFNHALIKSALFLAIAAVVYRLGSAELKAFKGLGRQMPWTMAAIAIGGLSLIGVPLTVGFVSKWYLVMGAIEAGLWPVAVLVLIGSLLALAYIWKIVEVAYFAEPEQVPTGDARGEAPLTLLIPIWLLVVANIYLGIDTSLTVGLSGGAAELLMEGVR